MTYLTPFLPSPPPATANSTAYQLVPEDERNGQATTRNCRLKQKRKTQGRTLWTHRGASRCTVPICHFQHTQDKSHRKLPRVSTVSARLSIKCARGNELQNATYVSRSFGESLASSWCTFGRLALLPPRSLRSIFFLSCHRSYNTHISMSCTIGEL